MKFDMFGQGNGPLSRAALSKNWIKTPYDLVNVMHSHLLEHRNKERFICSELFFRCRVQPPNPNHSFMKRFFTLIAAAMTFMASGWSQNTVVDIVVNSEDHTLLELAVQRRTWLVRFQVQARSRCLPPPTRPSLPWPQPWEPMRLAFWPCPTSPTS